MSQASFGSKAWLNCGSLGIPANDGTPDGWFLTLTPEETIIRCLWKRLSYNFKPEQQNMQKHGQKEYAKTLSNGLWPSVDILPNREREQHGKRLRLDELVLN